jgi:hypothetical protein
MTVTITTCVYIHPPPFFFVARTHLLHPEREALEAAPLQVGPCEPLPVPREQPVPHLQRMDESSQVSVVIVL